MCAVEFSSSLYSVLSREGQLLFAIEYELRYRRLRGLKARIESLDWLDKTTTQFRVFFFFLMVRVNFWHLLSPLPLLMGQTIQLFYLYFFFRESKMCLSHSFVI